MSRYTGSIKALDNAGNVVGFVARSLDLYGGFQIEKGDGFDPLVVTITSDGLGPSDIVALVSEGCRSHMK